MKLSETWLREWVNPELTAAELTEKLTMAGLESASTPAAGTFSNVVVAQVTQVEQHPNADRLKVCQVDVGQLEVLTIVCGAANVRPGLKVPAALAGASLPNDSKIKRSKIRDVVSNGMLCSSRELGLFNDTAGILELAADAPVGMSFQDYLLLPDQVFDISVGPNRGDCLSVLGMAREIAAATGCNLNAPHFSDIKVVIPDRLSVQVQAAADCPRYVGRVLKQVKADAVTPVWMQERLRRSGIHCLSPIVDVMNYVMLELGQPMHAFDLQKITGSIQVRFAQPSESLQLLDGQTIDLVPETLLIADEEKPLAIAGIMGGLVSGVTPLTQDIFIESAFFKAKTIARTRQHYHFSSESSYRFERGIDPALQVKAIERATELLLKITDGQPGPIIETASPAYLPQSAPIELRESQLEKILGFKIASMDIEMILKRLNFSVDKTSLGWRVLVPAVRSDISLEVDLIEEVMRLYGYEKLPANQAAATLKISQHTLDTLDLAGLRQLFCHMGYHEVITYSFVNKKTQYWLDQQSVPKELVNPITEDMTVMRTNLWPGLMNALLYNQNRQQLRVRLFEIGLRFLPQGGHLLQQKVLGGLINGPAFPEQWGVPTRTVDYFDLKGDLEKALELLTGSAGGFQFKPALHSALHPKQTAEIEYQGQNVGILGALDPRVAHELDVSEGVFLFELWLDRFPALSIPLAVNISKFPEIRRDIAIFVDQTVPVQYIQDTIKDVSGGLLREINIFDVYEGQGVPLHRKSIAVALTLQHPSRTLMEEEVAGIIYKIISALEQEFAAELRG